MGRRLCIVSLLLYFIVALSVYGPWDFLGAYTKSNLAKDRLDDGTHVSATGNIAHKEVKNDSVIYYIDDATICCEDGSTIKNSFFFKFDSKEIPIKSKVNIEGNVGHFLEARNEGGFDMKSYYNSMGYYFELRNVSVNSVEVSFWHKNDFLFRLSQRLLSVYTNILPNEEAGLLSSITIGNKSQLDTDVRKLFMNAGIAHILAVSSLHVSVVCMAIYRLLRKGGWSFFRAAIVSAPIAILYACLTGASISSIRAVGMFLIYLLADILGESYDSLTATAVMADILILDNPLVINNISFIYSFAAILAIVLIVLPVSREYSNICKQSNRLRIYDNGYSVDNKPSLLVSFIQGCGSSLVFSMGIYISMLPISSYMSYETPIYSPILNLIILPLMPFLLGFGLIGGAAGLASLGLARIILYPCHIIIFFFEGAAAWTDHLPFSRVIVGRHSIWNMALYYLILFVLVRQLQIDENGQMHIDELKGIIGQIWTGIEVEKSLNFRESLNGKRDKEKSLNPREGLKRNRKNFLLICVLIIVIGMLWLIPHKNGFEVDILDVGQGDGIFISSGDGVNYFIDGGSTSSNAVGEYTIEPFLKYKGINSIDYWFLSHMDLDHVSGILELLESGYSINNIVLSSEIPMDDTLAKLIDLANKNNSRIIYMKQGDMCGTRHLRFKCIYPYQGASSDDINALSLGLLMEYDSDADTKVDYAGFFGGDLGAEEEEWIAESGLIGHINLLKVSHHGSRYSSDSSFLTVTSPDVAVISCGAKNRYGHPADEAVLRLSETCDQLYYTMYSGRIRCTPGKVETFIENKCMLKPDFLPGKQK